jgi:glycosyltransferase involved in cell wall biosynthesis
MSEVIGVAFLMTEVPDLSGGGGAERFFYDFFKRNNLSDGKIKIHFFTDNASPLEKTCYLTNTDPNLHVFKLYRNKFLKRVTEKIAFLRPVSNFVRELITFIPLYLTFKKKNIKMLHIPLYEYKDYRLIWFFDKFAFLGRQKISLNIVDCRIPYNYYSEKHVDYYSSKINYGRLFENIRLDGIITWYELFREFVTKNKVIRDYGFIYSVRSRYSIVDVKSSFDKKEDLMIFSGRLDDQKDPMFFLKAIAKVVREKKEGNFRFKFCGKGPLEKDLNDFIHRNNLQDKVEIGFHSKMKEVVERSKCYVSTQLFENFPSMGMAEAMACGNAVIAKNVGQTSLFVKDNANGFLVSENDTNDLAEKLANYIALPEEKKQDLGKESIRLIEEVHNFMNFRDQFEEYTQKVLEQS